MAELTDQEIRFSNLELDDDIPHHPQTPEPAASVETFAPAPVPVVLTPPTDAVDDITPRGEKLIETTVYAKMGDAHNALYDHVLTIDDECRESRSLLTNSLHIDQHGELLTTTNPDFCALPSPHAYRQLAGFAPSDAASPINVNSWLHRAKRERIQVATRGQVATRADRARELYRVTSDYAEFTSGQIAAQLAESAPVGSTATVSYDRATTRTMMRLRCEDFSAGGDEHTLRLWLDTDDRGGRSVRVGLGTIRSACGNGLIMADWAFTRRLRHSGSSRRFKQLVKYVLKDSRQAMAEFTVHWEQANNGAFVDQKGEKLEAVDALRALISSGVIKVPTLKPSELFAKVKSAYAAEPGDSKASVLNAITRAAHETSWKTAWYQDELEEQAGALLYNQVQRILVPSDKRLAQQGLR